jgi:hypothetical protein
MSRKEVKKKYRDNNKESINEYNRRYREANKDKTFRRLYPNSSQEDYQHYSNQSSCECCGESFSNKNRKCQDHNHDTGELRGVICNRCNAAEGQNKTPERAYAVACYMASHTPLSQLISDLDMVGR